MPDYTRYHRQMLLPGIGQAGQQRLLEAHALIVGCGALGTMIADAFTRAGVGRLTIVDRDTVELTNLQRQVLFDEEDVASMAPKAEAARRKLERINSDVVITGIVDDFSARNAERYCNDVDVILDGLDNFETRYLLNDLAVKRGVPYVYGGAVGTTGMSMVILPHSQCRTGDGASRIGWTDDQSSPCLRCIFPEAPPPGTTPTCDTAGVLGSAVAIVAAHQVAQAIKLLVGDLAALDRSLLSIDLWRNETRRLDVSSARAGETCPCCALGLFDALAGGTADTATSLCGRNAVQITPPHKASGSIAINLTDLAERLSAHGSFHVTDFVLHGTFAYERGADGGRMEITVFRDGRAMVKGAGDTAAARSVYARYIGV